jgi:2-polyprenyl-6-methoxyphenol hydroxylase-like FAD-dependent oxidoreductase
MSENIAVVGAGIAGMCTALALAKQGMAVTIFERDIPPPEGDADQAFFEWQRRGAAQFRHPHAFLGLMCSLLEEHHPELLEDFFAAGARKVAFEDMVPPHLLEQYSPEAGDEKLWVLMCRRATMETVMRRYVDRINSIQIHNATYVTGIQTEQREDELHVTGLELTDRNNNNAKSIHNADVYVDAAGRASKFHRWLAEAGAEIEEQRDDAEIVYYTRHYKLKAGVSEPSRHDNEPAGGDLGYMKYGVFPGESGHFAVIICLPNAESELRAAVKEGDKFDAICRTIPGLVPWLAADVSEATTDSFGIGEISAVRRKFVKDGKAQAHNFFSVGDSSARTNPLYGRGCSIGILHAHILAEVLSTSGDSTERALEFERLTQERIGPIFEASLREDKNGIKRAEAVMLGMDRDKATSIKKWFGLAFGDAIAAAVRDEMHVFRGMMRTVNLIEKPGEFLQDSKVKRTILRYMLRGRKKNAQARTQRGPNRTDMLEHVQAL